MLLSLKPSSLAFVWLSLAVSKAFDLFPESFTETDITQYTVRYLSDSGVDGEDCLQGQPFPPPPAGSCQPGSEGPAAAPVHCRTIGYSILGNCANMKRQACTPDLRRNLIVLIYPGTYIYGETISVEVFRFTNLIIRRVPGCPNNEKVIFRCYKFSEFDFNNLYIQAVTNLGVDGIDFTNCGLRSPGVTVRNTTNATFANCEFRDNLHSGVFFNSSYDAVFENCSFKDNNSTLGYNMSDTLNSGGSFRSAGGLTLQWIDQQERPATVQIKNCSFLDNYATINNRNLDEFEERSNFYVPRGHGGGIIASFIKTSNITLVVEDSLIQNNIAFYNGGGIFASFFDTSLGNRIIINQTVIEGNTCSNTGGGISMNIFRMANHNSLIVENTNFTSNMASSGGGACTITFQDNLIEKSDDPNSIVLLNNTGVFKNCRFEKNYSPTGGGSAVSLVSNARVDQASTTTNFTDCQFLYNEAELEEGGGALMCFRFPISLEGTNIFKGNKGGGISLLQSEFFNGGHTLLEDNYSEEYGGGMALEDSSVIVLFRNANMTFVNNSAKRGGGLSVRSASVGIDNDIIRLFNTRCFLQYDIESTLPSLDPLDWEVSLNFIDNNAKLDGAGIYATDIERCTYTPNITLTRSQANSFNRSIFSLENIVHFNDGNNVVERERQEERVATAPSQLNIEPKAIRGAPGQIIPLTMSAVDESGNLQDAVWSVNLEGETNTSERYSSLRPGSQQYMYRVCHTRSDDSDQKCSPNETNTLHFSLVQIIARSVYNTTNVTVTVLNCYPGYYLNHTIKECLINRTGSLILRRDNESHYIYIKPQYYASYNETEPGTIAYAIIPIPFQVCNQNENTLSGCLFKYDNVSEQCVAGRQGFLCGSCRNDNGTNMGVDLTLIGCRECSVKDTIFVAIVVILFVVGCALILIFNIGIPNEMRGCLFFVQVVGFVYQYRVGDDPSNWDFHLSRVFGSGLYLSLCPLPATNALFVAAYGLILPVLAIITIFVYIISARFIKHLSNKNSFDGIWFLTFVIYKFVADTCFNVLRCQKVLSDGSPSTQYGDYVFYYDGNQKCFSTDDMVHLSFAIVALILGFMVILFPALILLISFKRFKRTQQLTDILNKDLKVSCRWWSSFDLFRRLLFIMVVLALNYAEPRYSQIALLFSGLFVFFVFACAQPYNARKANLIEALILLDLLLLTSLSLYTTTRQTQSRARPYSNFLLLVPFVALVLYLGAKFFRYAWKKWCPLSVKDIYYKCKRKIYKKLSWLWGHHPVSRPERISSKNTNNEEEETEDLQDFNEEMLTSEYVDFREELLDDDN